LKLLNM